MGVPFQGALGLALQGIVQKIFEAMFGLGKKTARRQNPWHLMGFLLSCGTNYFAR
jgi:hypothetical protein